MADKKVIIGGATVGYVTSVKASPESNTSSTATFDGAITQGADSIAWSLELSKIRFERPATHKKLSELLDTMWSRGKTITVRETVHSKTEDYTIVDNYSNCILEGNDYEIKPDDLTTESLKFKASKRTRKYE